MKKKISLILIVVLAAVFAFSACSQAPATTDAAESQNAPTEAAQASAEESTAPAEPESKEGFVVGMINGYMGNGWRTQLSDAVVALANEYIDAGVMKELNVQNAGDDVNEQIQIFRNMIATKPDMIMIVPNSQTALNPVIEEAHDAGILVVCIDQPVTSEFAVNVALDQYDWGKQIADWFVKEIEGKGDIIVLAGVAGGPSNVSRLQGQYDVLKQYPDIKVLTEVNGDWDQGTAQTVMSNVLASYPNIDGVLTQDGMSLGTVKAFQAAGRELPVISGETMVGFLRLWKELNQSEGLNTWAINDPPSVSTAALSIGIRLLQGKTPKEGTLKDNYFYYPVQVIIDNNNLDQYLDQYKDAEDTYFPDERLSEEAIDALFE